MTRPAARPLRIAVIGAGAMGSVFGAALRAAGHAVTLLDRRADHIAAINRDGLAIEGLGGDARHAIPATTERDALRGMDLALVLVDSAATAEAASIAAAVLAPAGLALTLQNGIGNAEALAQAVGPARTALGCTYVSAAWLAPGRVLHSNTGETMFGMMSGGAEPRLDALARDLAAAGLPAATVQDAPGHVWLKFALNCAINPVSALTGLRPGEVARQADARALMESVLDEILAVAAAKGLSLPCADPRGEILGHAWVRYNRPSMLQHVEAGRMPEIAALNGALVAEAERIGVPVPVNRAVAQAVLALAERVRRRLAAPVPDEAALEAAAAAEPLR
ncbi:MAG: 2-dehydropantoate 2-reductase [Pseudomonadota bacterium]|jgi:2-dehydropantoate 2-reductase